MQAVVGTYDVPNEWGKGIKKQGDPWEDFWATQMPAGSRLPDGFPVFDYFDLAAGRAVSNKTIDTTTLAKQAKPENIYYTMKNYVDKTADFELAALQGFSITRSQIKSREIELLVPNGTTTAQWAELARSVEYAKTRGVFIHISRAK